MVVYICQCYSQFGPPSPSRTASTNLFSKSVSLLLLCKQVSQYLESASYFSRRGHGGLYTVSLAGAQLAPSAVYSLPSGQRQTGLEGEGHVFNKTNWKMGHQGRQNCDNLKWLYMVAFLKKNNKKFQEPLQDPSLQLTQSICIKPSHATLSMLPHNHLHGDCQFIGLPWWLSQ